MNDLYKLVYDSISIFFNFEIKYIHIFLYILYILNPVKKISLLQNHKDILNIFQFASIIGSLYT